MYHLACSDSIQYQVYFLYNNYQIIFGLVISVPVHFNLNVLTKKD
jgi:hypothetical protein